MTASGTLWKPAFSGPQICRMICLRTRLKQQRMLCGSTTPRIKDRKSRGLSSSILTSAGSPIGMLLLGRTLAVIARMRSAGSHISTTTKQRLCFIKSVTKEFIMKPTYQSRSAMILRCSSISCGDNFLNLGFSVVTIPTSISVALKSCEVTFCSVSIAV